MTVLFVTLFVCIVWLGAFLYFGEKAKQKRKSLDAKKAMLHNFYKNEIEKIKLDLVGLGIDENRDYEFIQAVQKIAMPDGLKIQIHA